MLLQFLPFFSTDESNFNDLTNEMDMQRCVWCLVVETSEAEGAGHGQKFNACLKCISKEESSDFTEHA